MAYLGKTPSQAVRSRYYFTASGGETSLAPAQVTGLSFTDANYVDVSLNGVALVSGTDYTATPSTNTISGLSALTASDVVEIVVYDTFSVFGGSVNGDFNISGGTLAAEAVTVTGLTTTGDINFGDNDKAIFGAGSDLQIYHTGGASYVQDNGSGNLVIDTNGAGTYLMHGSEIMASFLADGAVGLRHDNSEKLATTSTGVDVSSTDATVNFVSSRGTGATHTITTGGTNSGIFNINAATGGDVFVNAENKVFRNAAGSSEHMRITSAGLVGIGTTSPEGLIGLPATASNTPKFRLQSASTNTDFAISSYADANGTYVSLGANHYLDSSGNDAVFETTDRSAYVLLDARNNGTVSFGTNSSGVAAERMRITNGGNVGISTTNPNYMVSLIDGTAMGLSDLADYSTKGILGNIHPSISSESLGSTSVDDVRNLGFGSTYTTSAGGTKPSSYGTIRVFEHYNSNLNKGARFISQVAVGHSNTPVWYARNSDTTNGTTYGTWYQFDMTSTSDERSKENVEDAPDQLAVVKQFQVKEFDYIDNADEPRQLGMMAQHVDTFAPEYVSKDAEDPDIMWRIKYNKMVPMLIKALQEAIAKIETLETQRADLEARLTALENAE